MSAADDAIAAELSGLGYEVVRRGALEAQPADALGKALVYLSESSLSVEVNTKFLSATTPVIVSDPALFDDMKLVAADPPPDGWGNTNGDFGNATQLDIVDATHPLAGGLPAGRATVSTAPTKLIWGVPTAAAERVASVPGQPGRFTVFAYKKGAQMAGMTAPARRVGLFLGDAPQPVAASWTMEARLLFQAAVRWAVEAPARALFVVGALPLSAADEALRARLANQLGFGVDVRLASHLSAVQTAGAAVVVVSETSLSTDVARKLKEVPVGQVNLEPASWDDGGLTGPTWMTDFGDIAAQTQLDIADAGHPLAAGLSGRVTVTGAASKFVWGRPRPAAQVVARVIGAPSDRAAIFAYESGAEMVDLRAPARRVGFFAGDVAAASFTSSAWALFDAAVTWAAQAAQPEVTVKAVCRVPRAAGFTAVFGYDPVGTSNVNVPIGPRNSVLPAPLDRGQPAWFKATGEPVAFTVDSAGEPVSWVVGTRMVTVHAATAACATTQTADGEAVVLAGVPHLLAYDRAKVAAGRLRNTPATSLPGMDGRSNVTDDGAFVWSMPIAVPSGRAGMQPNLSVSYHSRGANGWLGVGFGLSGLSQIRRCKWNLRQDPSVRQVQYDSEDALCLDGQRLVKVDGPPPIPALPAFVTIPAGAKEYRTERDSLARVFRKNGQDGQPTSFVVLTRDGRIHTYDGGQWAKGTRLCNGAPCGEVRVEWPLVETKDRFGNGVHYEYAQVGEGTVYELVPTKIRYTSSPKHPDLREVRFRFEMKVPEDRRISMVGGVRMGATRRLREIELYAPDPVEKGLTRTYAFNYAQGLSTMRTRLANLRECAFADGCRPPVEFAYMPENEGFTRIETDITDVVDPSYRGPQQSAGAAGFLEDAAGVSTGDLDGDGYDDVIYNINRSVLGGGREAIDSRYRFNTGLAPYFSLGSDASGTIGSSINLYGYATPYPIDLDGDQKSEIVATDSLAPGAVCLSDPPNQDYGVPTARTIPWRLDAGKKYVAAVNLAPGFSECRRFEKLDVRHADLDGDRLPDQIIGDITTKYDAFKNPTMAPMPSASIVNQGQGDRLRIADLDGAGRAQLVFGGLNEELIDVDGDGVADRVGEGYVATAGGVTIALSGLVPGAFRFGDLNGDGVLDAFTFARSETPTASTFTGHATGFRDISTNAGIRPGVFANGRRRYKPTEYQLCPYDRYKSGGGREPGFYCLGNPLSQSPADCPCGNCFYEHPVLCGAEPYPPACVFNRPPSCETSYYPSLELGDPESLHATRTLDVNGDGLTDLVQIEKTGTSYRLVLYVRAGHKSDLLTGVTSGEGARTLVTYSHMGDRAAVSNTHPEPFYTPGEGCQHPLRCEKRGMWMVKSLLADAGLENLDGTERQGWMLQEFSYKDGRSDVLGRGWLGFAERRVTFATQEGLPEVFARATYRYEKYDHAEQEQFPWAQIATDVKTTWFDAQKVRGVRRELGEHDAAGNLTQLGIVTKRGVAWSTGPNWPIYRLDVVHTQTTETEGPAGSDPFALTSSRFSRVTAQHDSFGNASRRVEEVGTSTADIRARTTTDSDYTSELARFHSLPASVTVRSEYRNQPGAEMKRRERVTGYDWDLVRVALSSQTREPEGAPTTLLTTSFVRNAEGLVAEVHSIGDDGTGTVRDRVSSVDYDAMEGMYPEAMRNAAGHVTRSVFHGAVDLPVLARDENGIVARFAYDRFGRPVAVDGPEQSGLDVDYARLFGRRMVTTVPRAGSTERTLLDRLGRVVEVERENFNGSFARYQTAFDLRGRPALAIAPYETTRMLFDGFNRPRVVQVLSTDEYLADPTNPRTKHVRAISYPNMFRTELTESPEPGLMKQNATEVDPVGLVTRREEWIRKVNESARIIATTYEYDPFALPTKMTVGTNATTMAYDVLGRRTRITTPDAGTVETRYDAFDSLRLESDSSQRVTTFTMDALGRPTLRVDQFDGILSTQEVTSFEYDAGPAGLGKLWRAISPDGVVTTLEYEPRFGEPSREQRVVSGLVMAVDHRYDSFGRLEKVSYPHTPDIPAAARFEVEHVFGDYDSLVRKFVRVGTGQSLWQVIDKDVLGRPTRELYGNGAERVSTFDPTRGWLNGITTTLDGQQIQALTYGRRPDGMLSSRVDGVVGLREGFAHDSLDRLRSWFQIDDQGQPVAGGWRVDYDIDDIGNIRRRSATSPVHGNEEVTYAYDQTGNAGPHAVTSTSLMSGAFAYDQRGNVVSHPRIGTIEYTPFNLPRRTSGTATAPSVAYKYDAFGERAEKHAGTLVTTYFGKLYERRKEGNDGAVHVFRVAGAAEVTRSASGESTTYVYDDHLGSADVIAREGGESRSIVRTKRDPFGNELPVSIGGALDPRLASIVTRVPRPSAFTLGFTGHEHDDELGLVNMNGRIYDGRLARFLQADPYVQDANRLNSHNRYSYVWNSPLGNTDPSGFQTIVHCEDRPPEGEQAVYRCTISELSIASFCAAHPTSVACGGGGGGSGVPGTPGSGGGGGGSAGGAGAGSGNPGNVPGASPPAPHLPNQGPRTMDLTGWNLLQPHQYNSGAMAEIIEETEQLIFPSSPEEFLLSAVPFERLLRFGKLGTRGMKLVIAETKKLAERAAKVGPEASKVLLRTEKALEKGFKKHGADFGLTGNWNPGRNADFSRAIHQHINSPGVRAIEGTYRGNPVTHYVDPSSGLNVMADRAGKYVSGWMLGAQQLESVLSTGRLF